MVRMYRGFKVCECQYITLPLIEADMKAKGIIKNSIDIYQGGYNKGGVAASAGTHDGGGVLDVGQYSDAALKCWREWGVEMQRRTRAQGFDPHGHGVWKGCNHVSAGARYQQSEWEAGRNGLRGRGPITGPDPKGKKTPTWQQAVKNHAAKPPAPPTEGVLGMTKIAKSGNTKSQTITGDGQWHGLAINDLGHATLITSPVKQYIAVSGVTISDLPVGKVAQLRYMAVSVFADKKTKDVIEYKYPIVELIGSEGSTFGELVWLNDLNGSPKKGADLRLRLFISVPEGLTVHVTEVTSRVMYA